MQVEMKDIESGTKANQRIRTEEKVERVFVEPREMQYLYNDARGYVFMDKENYEQLTLSEDMLEGQSGYLLPQLRRAGRVLQRSADRRSSCRPRSCSPSPRPIPTSGTPPSRPRSSPPRPRPG